VEKLKKKKDKKKKGDEYAKCKMKTKIMYKEKNNIRKTCLLKK
jgi:hypothetical protein